MKTLLSSLILAVLAVVLVFSSISFAEEQGKVKIENGVIYFPEKDLRNTKVVLSNLKFNFPKDCPSEILATKGKIFYGELKDGRSYIQRTYIIPLGYSSDTGEMILYFVTESGYGGKPGQNWLSGLFNPEGSTLQVVNASVMTQTYKVYFLKNGIIRMRLSNGLDGDYKAIAETTISESIPEKKRGAVKIENGVIYFPEANAPTVKLDEVKTNFSSDSPKEILAIKGKIYGGGDLPTTYLIPLGYDTGTKTLRLLKTTANEGTKFKPSKYTIGGVYNGSEGSSMKDVNSKPDAPPVLRFYIMPEKQGYKLHIEWETGGGDDLFPVAELPIAK